MQVLRGKVFGVAMFTTYQAIVVMTKKGSNAYSLSADRPRKKVAQFAPLSPTYLLKVCKLVNPRQGPLLRNTRSAGGGGRASRCLPLLIGTALVAEQRRKSKRQPARSIPKLFRSFFLFRVNIEVTRCHQSSKLANWIFVRKCVIGTRIFN